MRVMAIGLHRIVLLFQLRLELMIMNHHYHNHLNYTITIQIRLIRVQRSVPDLPLRSNVSIRIYDTLGRLVKELVNKSEEPGEKRDNLGREKQFRKYCSKRTIYYKLNAVGENGNKEFSSIKKMIMIK